MSLCAFRVRAEAKPWPVHASPHFKFCVVCFSSSHVETSSGLRCCGGVICKVEWRWSTRLFRNLTPRRQCLPALQIYFSVVSLPCMRLTYFQFSSHFLGNNFTRLTHAKQPRTGERPTVLYSRTVRPRIGSRGRGLRSPSVVLWRPRLQPVS